MRRLCVARITPSVCADHAIPRLRSVEYVSSETHDYPLHRESHLDWLRADHSLTKTSAANAPNMGCNSDAVVIADEGMLYSVVYQSLNVEC